MAFSVTQLSERVDEQSDPWQSHTQTNLAQPDCRNQKSGELPLTKIIPDPHQPRKTFDEVRLQQLADSIRQYGVLQPIRVRWEETMKTWVIISGENRWRASKIAEQETIPCLLIDHPLSEETIRVEQLVENCQRSDLRPMEQAAAMRSLINMTDWTTERLGKELSLSKATIVRTLALLKLDPTVQQQVANGQLIASVGYALSQVTNPDRQQKLGATIARRNLSREAALLLIENDGTGASVQKPPSTTKRFTTQYGTVTVALKSADANHDQIQKALQHALTQIP